MKKYFLFLLLFAIGCNSKNLYMISSLDDSAWNQSIWISSTDANVVTGPVKGVNERAADGSSWFVSTINNNKRVVSAKWMTTALGVYQLYVNGEEVGSEVLKPGFTHYSKTKISYTYDITSLFSCSKGDSNQLSVQVTPGWWADKIVTPGGHDGMIGRKCAFRGVLELTYDDNSTKLFGTNLDDWKSAVCGPVKHAAIFDGEEYDARELPGYMMSNKFTIAEENTEFQGEIVPSVGAEIYLRKDLALCPIKSYTWKGCVDANEDQYGRVIVVKEFSKDEEIIVNQGETLVVDFGQNCAAVPYFEFSAKEGTTLTCLPSELLNDGNGAKSRGMDGPEGSCHRRNLRTPETGMILKYTFASNDDYSLYYPKCTFFGYRLVSITATDTVHIRKIESIPVTSIKKELEIGNILTGNDLINKLISNALWGQRSNYLSVPTDCPQRNERLGWTADTEVFTETGTFFANTCSFFHKWMRDMRDTQSELGGYPGVAPKAQYGAEANSMMRVGWADAGIIVPWTIWKQFGDTSIVTENWESMEKFMSHVNETKYNHQALSAENGNYQWADWLSYEPLESCGGGAWNNDGVKPETYDYWNFLSASYWIIDAEMMRDMAMACKYDVSKYEEMLSTAKQYTKEQFLNEEGQFKTAILNTMQTPALFALRNELVQGEAKNAMISRLRDNFAQHGNCLQTGFLGTSILMKTLTDNGMTDIAYNLLFQRKNPSWLYSVDNGATTIWERWNSYTIESGMGPSGMNSFNHYAYGSVCAWIWETACGISADVSNPGFKHIILKPIPDRRLGSIDGNYNSAAGLISSSWHYDNDVWIWKFTIPEGATASVFISGEAEPEEYLAGSYVIERKL